MRPHSAIEQARRVASTYSVLHPTGCSTQFCEGGRMIHSTEPRVGQDRSILIVREEAIDFLCQLRRDGIIASDEDLQKRMSEVLSEIEESTTEAVIQENDGTSNNFGYCYSTERAGGLWHQTQIELEYGIRLAWKHSKRCIMRSQWEDLRYVMLLSDLRHIRTSVDMGRALIEELRISFNGGDILPTVFVFPPRGMGKRGPMIWNMQLFAFAGYEQADGTILGDPLNVKLTKAIVELGWKSPHFKTKWDLLPLVTMAEDEEATITEIPMDLFPLVHIQHPHYGLEFEKLGLRWVPAPALSRLGFDIGGVQYTATPFIGWFMDAEIGIRDLADRGRYNVLPSMIEMLGWIHSAQDFEELPEVEKLRLLSNAQSELNYAVFHSFQQSNIRMTDTLSASAMYCAYDDEHLRRYGFRLPADPYWLAPPQGSIIPLWHRGGSPNYQPKPLIARHVQDPIKAWKRSITCRKDMSQIEIPYSAISTKDLKENIGTIRIHYCSVGTTAGKLAIRLQSRLSSILQNSQQYRVVSAEPLNNLKVSTLNNGDVILLIVSSSGRGDIPPNGQDFARALKTIQLPAEVNWAVFGNGNSTYANSFNGAAKAVSRQLSDSHAKLLIPNYFNGDTAVEEPPWNQLNKWLNQISMRLIGVPATETSTYRSTGSRDSLDTFLHAFTKTTIVSCQNISPNIKKLVLNVGQTNYEPFMHAQVLVPNSRTEVKKILNSLGLTGYERHFPSRSSMTIEELLIHFVDLRKPFSHIRWAEKLTLSGEEKDILNRKSMLESSRILKGPQDSLIDSTTILSALPLSKPRHFSIASSQMRDKNTFLEFLVTCHPHGRFSAEYLPSARLGATLRLRFTGTSWQPMINDQLKPIIALGTGSGIAPIKYILQQRITRSQYKSSKATQNIVRPAPVSLFVGFRELDTDMISDTLHEAIASNIIDILSLIPSNPDARRAQDNVFHAAFREQIISKIKDESCYVFVCASPQAAKGFSMNLSGLLGVNAKDALGERYIEEVFEVA